MAIVLPDISLRQLQYLVAVDEAPTWATAAEQVGVSPSALSQGLAELERRVGVELFEPVGRRRMLRTSAAPVLDHARQVIALTGDLVRWSERVRGAASGRVRLGMIDVAAVSHFADAVGGFRRSRPDVDLTLSVAPSGALLDELRNGALDLVVCVEPPAPPPGITTTAVLTEPLSVIAPLGTTIGEPASWGPWLMFPPGSHSRHRVVERLRELGAPLRIAAESHQPDVLVQMVALGFGWAVLPVAPIGRRGEVVIGPEIVERELVVATREGAVHDPAVDALAEQFVGAISR